MMRQLPKKPPLFTSSSSSLNRLITLFRTGLVSLAASGALSLSAAGYVFAQEEKREFSVDVGEVVNEAFELSNSGQSEAALKQLESVVERPDLNAYERSTIFQMLGQYSYELNRTRDAQRYFERAIEAGGLLPKEVDTIRITIAQLLIIDGNYREGAARLEAYFKSGGQETDKHIDLLAQACVQAQDYRCALPWSEKWFEAADPKERRHYDLMNFLYSELGLAGRQADIIKEMINLWPEDKSIWETWISMLSEGGRDEQAFEVTKMLYLSGMLDKEEELLKLVKDHAAYNIPYQGAKILDREMKAKRISKTADNLKTLGTLYRQAREYERAISPLEAAAQASGLTLDDLRIFTTLGEALYKTGACHKAKAAFEQAVARGYDAGKARLRVGVCYADQMANLEPATCDMTSAQWAEAPISKARNAALSAFKSIPVGAPESADARKWITFLEADAEAMDSRCGTYIHHDRDICFHKIKQAYDARIFTGGRFDLGREDSECREYKAEYDKKFSAKPVRKSSK